MSFSDISGDNVNEMFESEYQNELADYIRSELDDGVSFEEILEEFDLTPEEVFVSLYMAGMIDDDVLKTKLLDL